MKQALPRLDKSCLAYFISITVSGYLSVTILCCSLRTWGLKKIFLSSAAATILFLLCKTTITKNGTPISSFTPKSKSQLFCASTCFTETDLAMHDKYLGALEKICSLKIVLWWMFWVWCGTWQLRSCIKIFTPLSFPTNPYCTTIVLLLSFVNNFWPKPKLAFFGVLPIRIHISKTS